VHQLHKHLALVHRVHALVDLVHHAERGHAHALRTGGMSGWVCGWVGCVGMGGCGCGWGGGWGGGAVRCFRGMWCKGMAGPGPLLVWGERDAGSWCGGDRGVRGSAWPANGTGLWQRAAAPPCTAVPPHLQGDEVEDGGDGALAARLAVGVQGLQLLAVAELDPAARWVGGCERLNARVWVCKVR
jgi:hypothetical protein